jgi:hypothetical protein
VIESLASLTHRRNPIAGALGAALLELSLRQGWIQRMRQSRVVSITPKGSEAWKKLFETSI